MVVALLEIMITFLIFAVGLLYRLTTGSSSGKEDVSFLVSSMPSECFLIINVFLFFSFLFSSMLVVYYQSMDLSVSLSRLN